MKKNSNLHKRAIKILLILFSVLLILLTLLIGWILLFFRVNEHKQKCVRYIYENSEENLNELVNISQEEKETLGIEKDLTPSKGHYEIRKCITNQEYKKL